MVLLCRCCHLHSHCLLAVCLVQVSVRQDVSPVVQGALVLPSLPHSRQALVSQQLAWVAEVDARQLAGAEAALVSPLQGMQQAPSQRQSGRGALQATIL